MAKKTEGKKVKRKKLTHKARRDMTRVSWEAREITANPDWNKTTDYRGICA